jgi:hypothetical protein
MVSAERSYGKRVREFGWGEVSSGPQPISQRGEQMSGRLVVTGHQGGRSVFVSDEKIEVVNIWGFRFD